MPLCSKSGIINFKIYTKHSSWHLALCAQCQQCCRKLESQGEGIKGKPHISLVTWFCKTLPTAEVLAQPVGGSCLFSTGGLLPVQSVYQKISLGQHCQVVRGWFRVRVSTVQCILPCWAFSKAMTNFSLTLLYSHVIDGN